MNTEKSRYESVKDVFTDSIDTGDFIRLDSSTLFYNQVCESIKKPLKMILIFGEPGTGKTILLNKIYNDLHDQLDIHYFPTPVTEEARFYQKLSALLTKGVMKTGDFSKLSDICHKLKGSKEHIVILDEAQLYNEKIMESVRLLSDIRSIKFIITLHKTSSEDVVAKKQFKTRIWESIVLQNASRTDLMQYLQKKLLNKNFYEMAGMIRQKDVAFVHRCTKGNFRETNKFMYTLFSIYEYYDKNAPSKIKYNKLSKKMLEMTAIKLGYINA
ncbi:MAG: AAA family ATPase [Campylobacterota bacterium]